MAKQQLTSKQKEQLKELVEHNRKQVEKVGGDQNRAEGIIECPHEEFAIYDVFVDETMREEVDPVDYYGYENIIQMINEWKKRSQS